MNYQVKFYSKSFSFCCEGFFPTEIACLQVFVIQTHAKACSPTSFKLSKCAAKWTILFHISATQAPVQNEMKKRQNSSGSSRLHKKPLKSAARLLLPRAE